MIIKPKCYNYTKCCSLLCIEYFTNRNEVTMLILLWYTSAFSEVIYADFYAKILERNFRVVDENSRILVVVFVSKLNFSFSFRFVDENCRIFVVVVVFVTKINLFSSTKIYVYKNFGKQEQYINLDNFLVIMLITVRNIIHCLALIFCHSGWLSELLHTACCVALHYQYMMYISHTGCNGVLSWVNVRHTWRFVLAFTSLILACNICKH